MVKPSTPVKKKARAKKARLSPARQAALKALKQVLNGQSLSAVQPATIDVLEDKRDRGLANELANGVLRWRWQLEFFVSRLLSKPLKQKDRDVQLILLMAVYELNTCRSPDYAITNDAVELVRKSGKKWAAGLVNAVLRSYLREKENLKEALLVLIESKSVDEQVRYSHPQWMVAKIKNDWPHSWQAILTANNQRPAFWLRVNQALYSVAEYRQLLDKAEIAFYVNTETAAALTDHALKLKQGMDVRLLPGFADGAVSVQDAGAQLVAELLNVTESSKVLDLCAAPGGKTCHLLERYHHIDKLVAVELDEQRMQRVSENLQRLKLTSRAQLIVADVRQYQQWWHGESLDCMLFDRILIDAPCSASGVIRRHPDIKTLRRESDIEQLALLQAEILSSAWQMLAPGGELLYVTCSVFKDENQHQIARFIAGNSDAVEIIIEANWGETCEYGRQLLPGEYDADGFYFCRLKKCN
jgi:16S rRNA (cytosine967-C5)-methyltransferase